MTTDVNLPRGVAIFGGTGFIGRQLIRSMSLKQNALIRVFTRNTRMVSNCSNRNIKYIGSVSNVKKLINIYDEARIFILPSYIEGFPKVISESLARLKPIIIFEDIKYVVNGRKGIFICKRNELSLKKNIDYILNNYKSIQKKIKSNFFYTKDNFNKKLVTCIENEFKN